MLDHIVTLIFSFFRQLCTIFRSAWTNLYNWNNVKILFSSSTARIKTAIVSLDPQGKQEREKKKTSEKCRIKYSQNPHMRGKSENPPPSLFFSGSEWIELRKNKDIGKHMNLSHLFSVLTLEVDWDLGTRHLPSCPYPNTETSTSKW